MIATQQIEIQNQHIILTNYRAAFWEEEETLFLSDLHVGKAAHFRKHGIAVPTSVMDSDLARSAAASATDTTHVLIPDAEDPQ